MKPRNLIIHALISSVSLVTTAQSIPGLPITTPVISNAKNLRLTYTIVKKQSIQPSISAKQTSKSPLLPPNNPSFFDYLKTLCCYPSDNAKK